MQLIPTLGFPATGLPPIAALTPLLLLQLLQCQPTLALPGRSSIHHPKAVGNTAPVTISSNGGGENTRNFNSHIQPPLIIATEPRHAASRNPAHRFDMPVINSDFPDPSLVRDLDGTWYAFATAGNGHDVQVARAASSSSPSSSTSTSSTSHHHHQQQQQQQQNSPLTGPWTVIDTLLDPLPRVSWATGRNTWAPDVSVLDDGRHVMYFSGEVASSPAHHCVGAAVSEFGILGPYVTPTDPSTGEEVPAVFGCDLEKGGSIDPSGFRDDNGRRYLLYKVDGNSVGHGGSCGNMVEPRVATPIMLQEMAADGVTPVGEPTVILDRLEEDGPLVEAPSLVKTRVRREKGEKKNGGKERAVVDFKEARRRSTDGDDDGDGEGRAVEVRKEMDEEEEQRRREDMERRIARRWRSSGYRRRQRWRRQIAGKAENARRRNDEERRPRDEEAGDAEEEDEEEEEDIYVLFFSSGCYADSTYNVKYATSRDIRGPYVRAPGGPMMRTGDKYGLQAPGGATAVSGHGLVFHADCGEKPGGGHMRCMHASPFVLDVTPMVVLGRCEDDGDDDDDGGGNVEKREGGPGQ